MTKFFGSVAASALMAALASSTAAAYTAYVSNEKGNTITVIDTEKLAVIKTVKVGQPARHCRQQGWCQDFRLPRR